MKNKKIQLSFFIISLTIVGIAYYFIKNNTKQASLQQHLPTKFKLGTTNNCRKVPQFIKSLGMRQPAIDSKQQGHSGGLLIRDIANNTRTWQDKSWLQSGYIGAFDRDSQGNIYVAPLPYVSLQKNPPEKQNQVYLIHNTTAKMSSFLQLPSTDIPHVKNPFGAMGLYYDCDTNSLYVSSIAGSLPQQEKGNIYQIDLNTKKVVSKLEYTDAIGVAVFNTLKGKRLYFGSARNSYIYSILLNQNGNFIGEKRYELALSEIQGGDSTVAKKIQFIKKGNKYHMVIKETEFGFRLMAENNLNRKKYYFQYSIAKDAWIYLNSSQD